MILRSKAPTHESLYSYVARSEQYSVVNLTCSDALHVDDAEKQAPTDDPLNSYVVRSEQCSVVSLTCSD